MRCSCGPGQVPCTFSPSTFLDIHMSQVKSCEHSLPQRICLTSFQSLCKNRCDVVTHPDMPDRSSLLFRAAACTYSQHEHNSITAALLRPMPNTSPVASDDPHCPRRLKPIELGRTRRLYASHHFNGTASILPSAHYVRKVKKKR